LRNELGILSRFLSALPLADLAPDWRTVKHGAGVYARVLWAANGVYAIYLDGDGPTAITLDLPAGDYAGEWTDIVTGNSQPVAFGQSAVRRLSRRRNFAAESHHG